MIKKITLTIGAFISLFNMNAQNEQTLTHLASYETLEEGSAETVAYDTTMQRAFFTNSASNSFSIIDLSNPLSPTLVSDISLVNYGGGPNSIAVSQGVVAVAIEADIKQDAGSVVLFDLNGAHLKTITAGALPDMLTYTPDGMKILVACEGEPNDDYSIDPVGSITIIDMSSGAVNATASSVDFTSYNEKKQSLKNKGIRIFGNKDTSTVAQDLEPEFITVIPDGSLAYINLQENNAFAVMDLNTNSIIDILPLGYKNHLLGTPSIELINLNEEVSNWPTLGTPVYDGGQDAVMLGGFSGMWYAQDSSDADHYTFFVVPDRGPNAAPVSKSDVTPATAQNIRPFKLPNYQGRIVKFTVNKTTGDVTLDNTVLLTAKDGITPITGKGNIPGVDEVPVTYTDELTAFGDTSYTSSSGGQFHELPYDNYGGDFEGILIDKNGYFWICDEYRPAIYKFESNGTLVERYVAAGTSVLGTTPQPVGTYGAETLPAVFAKRRANRGFEAIAYDSTKNFVYAFIQSPLYNPGSQTKNNSDVIRILEIDADNGNPVGEYVYLLERNKDDGYASSRVDKIGDAVFTENGKFLVIERDSEGPTEPKGKKYVFEIDLNFATNILDSTFTGKELEEMTADEIKALNIRAVHKNKVMNLPSVGYVSSDKAEGIALLPDNKIAVLNDNDFGLAGAGITDNSVLGIISFADDYGFDASNKDNTINITSHPTLGMFMPDGIASYSVGGNNYIVTVNEGDSRDYGGYSEEVRVKDLALNDNYYPDSATLQLDENLGRLKTTIATGDYNGDGTIEQIYSYGGRSFSIFDEYGNLVFDSGNQFGQKVLSEESDLFNEDEGEEEGRSDDKGCEPEAIAIGSIGAYTYAFIGLERQNSILVYDITDPNNPEFIDYYQNRAYGTTTEGDLAPEIIKFIPANQSPNNENLLLVGYELSGSMGIIQVGGSITTYSEEVAKSSFKVFPNPITEGSVLNFDQLISGSIIDVSGKVVLTISDASSINIDELNTGVYTVISLENGIKRFVKLK